MTKDTNEAAGSKAETKAGKKEDEKPNEVKKLQEQVTSLEQELKKKDKKIKELEDDLKWKQSDLENYRKSVEKRMDKERLGMKGKILKDFLPFFDAFDKAIETITNTKDGEGISDTCKKVLGGIEGLYKNLEGILSSAGIKRMEVEGKPFDYNYHEVVFQIEKPDVEEDTIIQEVQKGWLLDGKVLKPACVAVSKQPPKKEEPAEPSGCTEPSEPATDAGETKDNAPPGA